MCPRSGPTYGCAQGLRLRTYVPRIEMAEAAPTSCYFFVHIPKTAGTSVRELIVSQVPAEQVCPSDTWDELRKIPREDLGRYTMFRGHMAGDMRGFLGRDLSEFTILRRPLPWAVSFYWHMARMPSHRYHKRVRELGSLSAVR